MDAIVKYSVESITNGSKSFSSAARLFRREVREDAVMLYAWCRHCDDAIDGQAAGFHRAGVSPVDPNLVLSGLIARTERAIAGEPPDEAVFEALARVVARHRIPQRYPIDLLRGFAMDIEARQYETIEDTLDYCYHVAGVVGVMMSMVMGVRDRETLRRATDLGLAFQLTNIARDVADDAAMGRVYLPISWLREEGVDPRAVAEPRNAAAVARVVLRVLDAAEPFYASARIGLRHLPFRSGWAIATARGVYREIGGEVRRMGVQALSRRAQTRRSRKLVWTIYGALQASGARTFGRLIEAPQRGSLWSKTDMCD